jgi:hypothetical protein
MLGQSIALFLSITRVDYLIVAAVARFTTVNDHEQRDNDGEQTKPVVDKAHQEVVAMR